MKHIVLFGAGKSATCLIDFLLKEMLINDWRLTVCDSNLALAESKTGNTQKAKAVSIMVENDIDRNSLIQSADIVISLLPPQLHFIVAKDCVALNKNLLTASYVDEHLQSLAKEIEERGLLFLCEMGLDPGIDHMSAMKMIQSIKKDEGNITSFKSHCGGLIAPESDTNLWHYKITWNPRNVVLAGKDGAVYKKENNIIEISSRRVFRNTTIVNIEGLPPLSWYPNRDSLSYIPVYGLESAATFIRTTLRYPSFCRGWDKLVNIGLTALEDYERIKSCKTLKEWYDLKVRRFVATHDWNKYLHYYVTDPYRSEFVKQLHFLGLETNEALPENFTCSADILQHVMEKKMVMKDDDKDMILMLHEIEYTVNNQSSKANSTLIVKGEDNVRTAMAKTVGLPLGIAVKFILQQKIKLTGLHIPTVSQIYEPVLDELENHGIMFRETFQTL
ncbi:MAG: saccharopine dehydrogenase NADP-binding domain-containing protein [Chitinophagaceae bacterium]|nr:saccharopine dehydrogenase NADP-binding domain-containing protein [Chitinophagaceae bacterium]